MWNDVIIPGMDYAVVEKTPGKYGKEVKVLTELPVNLQEFVGKVQLSAIKIYVIIGFNKVKEIRL